MTTPPVPPGVEALVKAVVRALEASQVSAHVGTRLRCVACGKVAQVIQHEPGCWASELMRALTAYRAQAPVTGELSLREVQDQLRLLPSLFEAEAGGRAEAYARGLRCAAEITRIMAKTYAPDSSATPGKPGTEGGGT